MLARLGVIFAILLTIIIVVLMARGEPGQTAGNAQWEQGWLAAIRAVGDQNQTSLAAAMRVDADYRRCKGTRGAKWNDAAMACEY